MFRFASPHEVVQRRQRAPPVFAMPDGIVFALGALVCAALNDIVFKKAVGAGISVGWFASMIGTTWGLVQACGSASLSG